MNRKVTRRAAMLLGAASMITAGALATTANANANVSAFRVEATATQVGKFSSIICIGDNTTAACTTLKPGQSFARFPSYNSADGITISVRPVGTKGEVFKTVRATSARLTVVIAGTAAKPVVTAK